jgi:hypothetical protein
MPIVVQGPQASRGTRPRLPSFRAPGLRWDDLEGRQPPRLANAPGAVHGVEDFAQVPLLLLACEREHAARAKQGVTVLSLCNYDAQLLYAAPSDLVCVIGGYRQC